MLKQKPLKCSKCGHRVGTVRIKPKFQRKLLYWSLAIAFIFEFIANFLSNLLMGKFK